MSIRYEPALPPGSTASARASSVMAEAFGISQDRMVAPTVLHDAVAETIELRVRIDWAEFLRGHQ